MLFIFIKGVVIMGQNLLEWFQQQAQPLVLIGIMAVGVFFIFKRETSKLLGFVIIAVAAVLLVFNVTGVKDILLALGNQVLGAGG